MSNRIILITGATSGIGRELAKKLVGKGDFPVLVGRNIDALHELQSDLKKCAIYPCDITQQDQVQQLVNQVIDQYGRVDVLVNNAGHGTFGGALDVSITDYKSMIETNYLGAVYLTYKLIPHMLDNDGRIINIASVAGLTGIPNLAAYCASKYALIGFSESLRMEFSPRIKIGVLCSGPVQTPFFRDKTPNDHFPPFIARQTLDVQTVAEYAIKLIERPRMLVIPNRLRWAIRFKTFFPRLYEWVTKKMYHSFQKETRERTTIRLG